MKIALIQTGKTTDSNIMRGCEEYSGRIKRYTAFETITLPDLKNTKNMPVSEQKAKEAAMQTGALLKDDFVVVLDEAGREFRTVDFAAFLSGIMQGSKKRIVFMIGGPWGFDESVLRKADLKLSVSKFTFSHQLVRLLFAEQLYRVLSVIKGDPYHHE
jgi:23S rRNA (pseudouridine1915-N3)-methyltransferase